MLRQGATTILAKDKEVEMVGNLPNICTAGSRKTLDGSKNSCLCFSLGYFVNKEKDFMEYDLVCPVGSRISWPIVQ